MQSTEEREPPDVITSDTDNRTKVQPKEAPPHKREKFRRFRAYNTGTWNGPKRENKEVVRRQDDLHRYDSIASTLLLNRFQKEKGRRVFDELNFHTFGYSIDHIIFGICAVVANDDVENGTRFWPQHPDQIDDDYESEFADLGASMGLDWKEQMSAIKKVQSRVDF